MSEPLDALVIAAHPDDAELGCGGTMLLWLAAGRRVGIVDMTEGEKGTRGTVELRREECAAATAMLGLTERVNLKLPDTELSADDDATLAAVVGEIRRLRPRLLLTQHPVDVHPDHVATGRVVSRAFFHAGLRNFRPDLGEAFRPHRLFTFPGNDHVEPTFCVDISAVAEQKRRIVECYGSQVNIADTSHLARKLDPLERSSARERYFGAQIGTRAAEAFVVEGPLRIDDVTTLLL